MKQSVEILQKLGFSVSQSGKNYIGEHKGGLTTTISEGFVLILDKEEKEVYGYPTYGSDEQVEYDEIKKAINEYL